MNKNQYNDNTLNGRRHVNWMRCSTKGQADTSLDDQLRILNEFASRHHMIHVDDVILDGVSGLNPRIHEIAEQLVARKRQRDEFDVVLVHDLSRLTRMGSLDGAKIEYEFRKVGIELISVTDDVPNDEFGAIFKSMKHYAANQQSKAIAQATTRGSMSSLLSGKRPHCNNAPYGIDRRVWGPDDKPRFILRLLVDGRQQKLELRTLRVIETFEPNVKTGAPNHYRLQPGEWIDLIPGDPDHVATVNLIYRLHYLDGWGDHLIAKQLNERHIASPRGKGWSTTTVNKILRNAIYTGVGIANRETTGRYFKRSPDGPEPTDRTHAELANYTQPPRQPRPRQDWQWIEQPALCEFLEPQVCKLAKAKQEDYRRRRAERRRLTAKDRDRHRDSHFILKRRLVDRKTGLPLTGRSSRRKEKIWRYYGISKAFATPAANPEISSRLFPAAPINQLVIGLLGNLIRSVPDLRTVIRRQVERELRAHHPGADASERLHAEREGILKKLGFVIENVTDLGEEVAGKKMAELVTRRNQIDRELAAVDRRRDLSEETIDQLVDDLIDRIHRSDEWVRRLGMIAIDRLLDLLLAKAVVDLETREIEIEFRLPKWALDDPESLCLVPTPDWPSCRSRGRSRPSSGGSHAWIPAGSRLGSAHRGAPPGGDTESLRRSACARGVAPSLDWPAEPTTSSQHPRAC